MKQILGTSYNIEDDIVGRITFGKGNLFRRSNDILVPPTKQFKTIIKPK